MKTPYNSTTPIKETIMKAFTSILHLEWIALFVGVGLSMLHIVWLGS